MHDLAQRTIIGIDVCRDWLDIYDLSTNRHQRVPNKTDGHKVIVKRAQAQGATVCFESTGGLEWPLWQSLAEAGIPARQLPPAQVKAFAKSCGTQAKTDRVDAVLIARFLAFRPKAGRELPLKTVRKVRALTTKRSQLVEARKRLLMQLKAQARAGLGDMFASLDCDLQTLLARQIKQI